PATITKVLEALCDQFKPEVVCLQSFCGSTASALEYHCEQRRLDRHIDRHICICPQRTVPAQCPAEEAGKLIFVGWGVCKPNPPQRVLKRYRDLKGHPTTIFDEL